jgi:hypothetical protein
MLPAVPVVAQIASCATAPTRAADERARSLAGLTASVALVRALAAAVADEMGSHQGCPRRHSSPPRVTRVAQRAVHVHVAGSSHHASHASHGSSRCRALSAPQTRRPRRSQRRPLAGEATACGGRGPSGPRPHARPLLRTRAPACPIARTRAPPQRRWPRRWRRCSAPTLQGHSYSYSHSHACLSPPGARRPARRPVRRAAACGQGSRVIDAAAPRG